MRDKLDAYEDLLRAFAPRLNLVSRSDLDHLRTRHIEDSLRLLPLLDSLPEGPCIDVGSGAGLPGVPLASADPSRHWVLLEPRVKRAAFLEEVVRTLDLDAEVVCDRAEVAVRGIHRARYALATARALAEPAKAADLLAPFLCRHGLGAIFLGAQAVPPQGTEVWSEGIAIVRLMPTDSQGA